MSDADNIVSLYQRKARAWMTERERQPVVFEKPWLDEFRALLPPAASILDIGCGSGQPLARYFIENQYDVTGVDSSPAMIDVCRARFPEQQWTVADMRQLSLHKQFAGILAWDSFFHLAHDDQRRMFPIFKQHARPKAALMFTSGPAHGEAIGQFEDEPLYHASLAPDEYRALLDENGFKVAAYVAEDPACGGHTIWLAQLA